MSIDLSSPEAKEAIKAAVEEATSALASKNRELLTELKEARKGKQVSPEEVEKLQSHIDDLTSNLTEAQKQAKAASKEAETARKQLQDAEGYTQRLLVDNGLTDALAKAGVTNPAHMKAVKAMLSGQVQVVAKGDQKIAKVGDKALGDFVGEWAKGDEGKFFVSAPNNSGGSAGGGSPAGGAVKGDLGGDKAARQAALAARFPDLKQS